MRRVSAMGILTFRAEASVISLSQENELLTYHRIALPNNDMSRILDGFDMPRQELFHLVRSVSTDQCNLSRDIVRIDDYATISGVLPAEKQTYYPTS